MCNLKCFLILSFSFLQALSSHAQIVPTLAGTDAAIGPVVVIKADDLRYHADGTIFGAGWNRFLEVAQAKKIKISMGIICVSLGGAAPEYFERIRALHDTGQVEFWNHGYTHGLDKETGESEFYGPDFETQLDTLNRSQALALEKLGFPLTSFGTPFNYHDENTARALREHPEITSWIYGSPAAELLPGQVVLHRWVNLEKPVHYPNFEAFQQDFLKNPNRPYYLLQGHPNGWDAARLEQFVMIIDFLQARDALFITPTELQQRVLAARETKAD